MNVVLTGFMGTGKSAVGRSVAATLGLDFVDMDDAIAERAGKSISDVFALNGETAFRDLETAIAVELGARDGLVIATGGGALLRAENREALGRNGLIVCLTGAPDEILRRLAGDGSRPLLAVGDEAERLKQIEALLAARAPVYDHLPLHVDTSGRTIGEVAALVIQSFEDAQCRRSTLT